MPDKDSFEAHALGSDFATNDTNPQATVRLAVEFHHTNSWFIVDGGSSRLKQVRQVFHSLGNIVLFRFLSESLNELGVKLRHALSNTNWAIN